MATEEGVVLTVEKDGRAGTARVRTVRSSACESCSSKDSCRMGEGGMEMEVEAINTAHAKPGDRVLLRIKTGSFVKAAFLLYLFPVLCMVAGAFLGQHIAGIKGSDPSVMAAIMAFSAFGVAFFIIRMMDRLLAHNTNYKPEIIKIRWSEPLPPDASGEEPH
ncbi:SoxR reducing system RseC family protein [Desulfosarcina sp. OttesenSCG-928-A07]|nr:SoxR reducing system RseC family protein [Desulfosarcina sp. OttesenSCG-928-G17]MDL2329651.1 SoxR reducing system RseC family protein [Desulfosarcina sp. OttesenSCG-928-A07]